MTVNTQSISATLKDTNPVVFILRKVHYYGVKTFL